MKPPLLALRSYYVNFAEHLQNAWNPNLFYPGAPNRWSPEDWRRFLKMVKAFGFNVFEYWLAPTLMDRKALERSGVYAEFAATMRQVNVLAHEAGLQTKALIAVNTIGPEWFFACPHVPAERELILALWRHWMRELEGTDVVGIFPGDPGGCNRNGCDQRTFLDLALQITELILKANPAAAIELNTWGTPFSGWGDDLLRVDGWDGTFAAVVKLAASQGRCHIWNGTPDRARQAMADLLARLPKFPRELIVGINLGFSPDADCTVGGDARSYVRELAKSHRVASWDYAVTEGELVVHPHWRLSRVFSRRREERAAGPYYGAMAYTMSPMLSHLCMYAAGQAAIDPDRDPDQVAGEFCRKVFGAGNERLGELFEAFEVVPGWGHYPRRKWSAAEACRAYSEIIARLESADVAQCELPLFPSPEQYRSDLLWFARLLLQLASPEPNREAVRRKYWRRTYGIYETAPRAVDERSELAARSFSNLFGGAV